MRYQKIIKRLAGAALALGMFCAIPATHCADAPAIGKEEVITITSDLPRLNGYFHYNFYQPISSGERLRFIIKSVDGVVIKTQIFVKTVVPNKPKAGKIFEQSPKGESQDWLMMKRPPGDTVAVSIHANSIGKLLVRIEKVKD